MKTTALLLVSTLALSGCETMPGWENGPPPEWTAMVQAEGLRNMSGAYQPQPVIHPIPMPRQVTCHQAGVYLHCTQW